jgi:regulator of cell morphogenesis and NO signaling
MVASRFAGKSPASPNQNHQQPIAMSHVPNVFSPPGTPLPDRTVGELVAERPGRSRVFQSFQIDFCCQGGRTLREACKRKGVALDAVVEQLEAEQASPPATGRNPADLPPAELVDHILGTHHEYLRGELPRLHAMAERVARVHGGHTPALVEVFNVFRGLAEELTAHMMKEEKVLFPAIVELTRGASATVALEGPLACMIHEHDDAGAALERLRELTRGVQPPPEACHTYRALFAGLADLEEDLHTHIHLENAVLFPQARALAGPAAW